MINLSIIIPCSRPNTIIPCLKSLLQNDVGQLKIEIIVTTLNHLNLDLKELKNYEQVLKIRKTNTNHPSLMRNIGAREAQGEFLVFLDDDTVIPSGWLKTCYRLLSGNPNNIICGPNNDNSSNFGHSIANAIQSLYISEGSRTHEVKQQREVDHHNVALSNCALNRKIFERIGGFNDEVDYYLDDTEFFYIAHKLGYKLIQYPELTVQHHCRSFPIAFLKHKFFARKKIGYNVFFFPEIYKKSLAINLLKLSYLIIPIIILLFFAIPKRIFLIAVCLYVVVITISSLKFIIKSPKYIILPIGIFLAHIADYAGFTWGFFNGVISFKNYKKINTIKRKRYAIFSDRNNQNN